MLLNFIRCKPGARLPVAPHNDIASIFSCVIRPDFYEVIPTGLIPIIPEGYELHIRSRYSLASKWGIYALHGVIHPRTKEEIHIVLFNSSPIPYHVKEGDLIAQVSLVPVVSITPCFAEGIETIEYSTLADN